MLKTAGGQQTTKHDSRPGDIGERDAPARRYKPAEHQQHQDRERGRHAGVSFARGARRPEDQNQSHRQGWQSRDESYWQAVANFRTRYGGIQNPPTVQT